MQLVPGTPKNISTLLEDRIGRLWIGTRDGAYYFDGQRSYSLAPLGFPANTQTFQIAEATDGAIWFASNRGLYRLAQQRVEQFSPLVAQSVIPLTGGRVLASLGSGKLSTTSNVNLTRFTPGAPLVAEPLLQLNSEGWMTVDNSQNVLFACPPGWCEIPRPRFETWTAGSPPLAPIRHATLPTDVSFTQVHRDPAGCVWTGTEGFVNYLCPGEKSHTVLPTAVASSGGRLVFSPNGDMLILSISRLAIGRPGNFKVYSAVNGFRGAIASHYGSDGTLWLASDEGLIQWKYPGRIEFWTERDGLLPVTSVVRFPKTGKTFAGAVGGMLELALDRRSWSLWPQTEQYRRIEGLSAAPDGESMLAGLPYRGAAIFSQRGEVLALTPERKLSAWHFARSPNGQLWSSGNALGKLLRSGRELVIARESLPGRDNANALDIELEPRSGVLWACYSGGLIRREGNSWTRITTAEGLIQDDCRSIAPTPDGNVWYGYSTAPAFSRIRPSTVGSATKPDVKHFQSGPGIGRGQVHFLDTDSRGWLWRGAADGVHVASTDQAEAGFWHHFDESQGLPAMSMNQQAFYSDPDGSVWFAGDNNLVHFSPPEDFLAPRPPLTIYISAMSRGSESPLPFLFPNADSAPSGVPLKIHVGASRARHRNSIRLRYRHAAPSRLEQAAWQESPSLDLEIPSPPWGDNIVEVQARPDPLLPWSPSVRQTFTVIPPLWSRWYVFLPGLIAPLSGYYWFIRRRRAAELTALPDLAEYRLAALVPEANQLIGAALDGRFRILRLIARGGFATVLRADDLSASPPLPVAVKVFRPEVDPDWLSKRVAEEIKALVSIDHPNVVRFLAHGHTPSGAPYIVMEFIEGRTLAAVLADPTEISPARCAQLLDQLAAALDATHARGIFHRDLKPDNVMLRDTPLLLPGAPDLVLIDFSIAIVKDPDQSFRGLSRAAGTYVYMAPEQAAGFACEASDVYSFAKMALELLFRGSVADLIPNAALDLPDRARAYLESQTRYLLSREAIGNFVQAFEFDPRDRPSGVRAFIVPLLRSLRGENPEASDASTRSPSAPIPGRGVPSGPSPPQSPPA